MAKANMNLDVGALFEQAQSQFSGLNPNEPGQWPWLPKVVSFVVAAILMLGVGWVALLSGQRDELDAERGQHGADLARLAAIVGRHNELRQDEPARHQSSPTAARCSLVSSPMPFFAKPIAKGIADKVMSSFVSPQVKLHFDYLEQTLASSEWFAGKDFSVADIQLSFPIEAAAARGALGPARPKLAAFLEKIHARPAYQRALAKGGPYELMR